MICCDRKIGESMPRGCEAAKFDSSQATSKPSYARLTPSSEGHTSPRIGYDKVYGFRRSVACHTKPRACEAAKYGQEWIRTTEGVSQQIYSLPRLATSVPTRDGIRGSPFAVLGLRLSIR